MYDLLTFYLTLLLAPRDISFTINGSSITFTKEGDVIIKAGRNLIESGKYIFTNCSEDEIKTILYKEGLECLQPSEEEIK